MIIDINEPFLSFQGELTKSHRVYKLYDQLKNNHDKELNADSRIKKFH